MFKEEAAPALNRFVQRIVLAVMRVFGSYQARNITRLYGAFSTIAGVVVSELADAKHLKIFTPPPISNETYLLIPIRGFLVYSNVLRRYLVKLEKRLCSFHLTSWRLVPISLMRCTSLKHSGNRDDIDAEFLACNLNCISEFAEVIGLGNDTLLVNNSA